MIRSIYRRSTWLTCSVQGLSGSSPASLNSFLSLRGGHSPTKQSHTWFANYKFSMRLLHLNEARNTASPDAVRQDKCAMGAVVTEQKVFLKQVERKDRYMKHYQYLIIGGGLAGDAAVRGIRELDAGGSIGMFSAELNPPYTRPNLSKGLWKGRPLEKVWRDTKDLGAELLLGRKVTHLDPLEKCVSDELGDDYAFDKLLLATGGSPVRLPFGGDDIIYFHDLQDYQRLRAMSEDGEQFLVIGGGFIGSEIAAALTMVGKKVVMVFPEETIGARVFPNELSSYLNDYYRRKGVEVLTNDSVTGLEKNGSRYLVRTRSGGAFEVDGVVAGIGIRPNVEL